MELIQTENNYILKNKTLELWMNHKGKADRLIYNGQDLIENLNGNIVDPDRHNSFYLDYHQDLQSKSPKYNKVEIREDTRNSKHIVWLDTQSDLYLEYHIIMNSEDSKLYSYVVARNNTNKTFKINELRTVYRLDSQLFPFSKTNARQGLQPSSNYTNKFQKLQDETYKMPDGERFSNSKLYSKYDYADYFSDNNFWGFFGKNIGFWCVPVSKDYYPSGPLKQELMVHYDGILLNYLNSAHFGTSDFTIKPGWKKMYGPWCIYLNKGNNYSELFSDVDKFTKKELVKWPYSWVNDELYPLKRIDVEGRIKKNNSYQLMVVLSQGSENFAKASAGYIYYAKTDENGFFTLGNVRPGKYKLTTYYCEGDILGEFVRSDIDIESNDNELVDLGNLTFEGMRDEKVLWQIGSASHTTESFKFSNQLRNTIWRDLVPANLHYFVGQSDDVEDWYSIQSNRGKWRIHFDLKKNPNKKYYLKIALAGASKTRADYENDRGHRDPRVDISLNGQMMCHEILLDDTSVYRNALKSGSYHLLKVELPIENLVKNNTVGIQTDGYLMYDTIELIEK